jgi:hypothetical protein
MRRVAWVERHNDPLNRAMIACRSASTSKADLYALLSKCKRRRRRGYSWDAIFFKEISAEE